MILCLDVGNSQVFAGVFDGDVLKLSFRCATQHAISSDQLGVFLKSVLRENQITQPITRISICSVVPAVDYSLRAACIKYFRLEPFILQAGVKTGLKIQYRNPVEVGADRIANAIAASHLYAKQNLIVVDFGTATTFCVISADKSYLGGLIMTGMRLSMEALQAGAAKLPSVEIVKPETPVGRSTKESMQAGLFYSQIGGVKEITQQIQRLHFSEQKPLVIGTGGFAYLFQSERLFDHIEPNLVLTGLKLALSMNE